MALGTTVAAGAKSSGRGALTANTVTTVTFADNIGRARVIADGTAAVYVTFDGSTPTVDGANTLELPSGAVSVREEFTTGATDAVSLISTGTPSVRVERVDG